MPFLKGNTIGQATRFKTGRSRVASERVRGESQSVRPGRAGAREPRVEGGWIGASRWET